MNRKHLTTHPDIIYQKTKGEDKDSSRNLMHYGGFRCLCNTALLPIGTKHCDDYYKRKNEDID